MRFPGEPCWKAIVCATLLHVCVAASHSAAEEASVADDYSSVLTKLGVVLKRTERPAFPKAATTSIQVTLSPQVDEQTPTVVSFGLPFPPNSLTDDKLIRVIGPDGQELPAFTKPLVYWWIDRKKGALRSVLVQFALKFSGKAAQKVTLAWDKPRAKNRDTQTPIPDTQFKKHEEPADKANADAYDWQSPKVLALLPTDWLCASLVAWQQVNEKENTEAPWFDKHLGEQFDGSLKYISANRGGFEAHLFDRPATYAKAFVRRGEEKFLTAALQANDYYIQHIDADGYFNVKPGKDHKYIYTEGSAIMYMLTGDERYKEAISRMLKAWEQHTAIEYKGKGFWTERHHGFGLLALVHAFELTGDGAYLDKAKRYFEAAFSLQIKPVDGKAPDGAWVHSAESHGDGNGWTTSPWMSCFLIDGIWKYWMLSGDPRAPASLALYARFEERNAITSDGKGVFYMANSSERGASDNDESPPHNMEACYVMALGHYLAQGQDPTFMKRFVTLWPPIMEDSANRPGRKFNWRFRETSMLMYFLRDAKTETAPVASSKSPDTKPSSQPAATVTTKDTAPLPPAQKSANGSAAVSPRSAGPSEHRAPLQAALRSPGAKKGTATWSTLMDKPEAVRFNSADEQGVNVTAKGNTLPLRWKEISDQDLARIAFDCLPDDADALYHAAVLAVENHQAKLADNIADRLATLSPTKLRELTPLLHR